MRAAEMVRAVRWYLREVAGETAYDRYLDHARRTHPDAPVLSRRQFERQRMDRGAAHSPSRCC